MTSRHLAPLIAAALLAACSTPIDIQPPAPQPDAPRPPESKMESPRPERRVAFTCPAIDGDALQPGNRDSAPSIRTGINFHQFRNLRFETLSLVRDGMLSSRVNHGLTSRELDQLFHTITGALAEEWRQRLAWVTPPGRGGDTISVDLWLADLPTAEAAATGATQISITLRDNSTGDLLLSQCHVPLKGATEGSALAAAVQAWASTLASHMEAASH